MTTIYENQSVAFTDLTGNIATISPAVGFTITTPTQTLTANVNGFTNGVQTLLFSDLYAGVQKTESIKYLTSTATSLNIQDTILVDDVGGINSTTIQPNYMSFDAVGDTHQTHIDNTQVHILDTSTNDEMFIDHNSLILVQPTTTHQTELLGNMLDFQTPENIISCGHTTYQDGHPGFECYDLGTGDSSLLGITRLRVTSATTGEESVLEATNLTFTSGVGNTSIGFNGLSVEDSSNTISSVITEGLITLTSGATSNTLDSSNWSGNIQSVATTANATHYLGFFDSSSTGYGKPQKSTGLTVNPSTKTITATTFVGALTGTSTNANNLVIATDNTSGNYYIPFSKLSAGTNPLYVDDFTSPLTYNPASGLISALFFSGDLILPTTANTATFASGTLSVSGASNGSGVSRRNSNITITGGSNTISALSISNMIVNGKYSIGILNSGSGNLTVNTGLGTNIRTIYSGSFNISSGRYGLMTIQVITINATTQYIVNATQLTN